MSDDVLGKLFDKLDGISDRMARVETMLKEREKRCDNERDELRALRLEVNSLKGEVDDLEKEKSILTGARGITAWLITTLIAVWGALHK